MNRTSLSDFRTLLWGRGFVLLFSMAGLVPSYVILMSPENFDWFGGPPPWYAPLVVLGLAVLVVSFVHRVVGHLQPVAVADGKVIVSKWIGEETFPMQTIAALYVDRTTKIGGMSPVRIEFELGDARRKFSFLLAHDLDFDDVEKLTGVEVEDAEAFVDGNDV